jgi:hypothetical protein
MALFEKILENNNKSAHVHFGKQTSENSFETLKFDHDSSKILQLIIKKISGNKCKSWCQYDTYFNNMVKTEKCYQNDTSETLYTINYFGDYNFADNQTLIVVENKEQINKENFPSLNDYDKIIKKKYDAYHIGSFDVVFVMQNNEITVYIDVSNMKNNDVSKSKFEEVRKSILNN